MTPPHRYREQRLATTHSTPETITAPHETTSITHHRGKNSPRNHHRHTATITAPKTQRLNEYSTSSPTHHRNIRAPEVRISPRRSPQQLALTLITASPWLCARESNSTPSRRKPSMVNSYSTLTDLVSEQINSTTAPNHSNWLANRQAKGSVSHRRERRTHAWKSRRTQWRLRSEASTATSESDDEPCRVGEVNHDSQVRTFDHER